MRIKLALLVTVLALVFPAVAVARSYAPLNQPGPALSVPKAKLRASLYCQPGVRHARVAPVLLNPGTSTTPTENFGWNWEPALNALHVPWCAYTAPNQALGRIDVSGEYLVYAIRTMHRLAGRRIAILGHSQGGMSMRWALRFWPDTRSMVSDVIGLEPSNHGTTLVTSKMCESFGCTPAVWQQAASARFIAALNSGAQTFKGIAYTNTYSHEDEVVTPNISPQHCASCLSTGRGQISNVALQSICPNDIADHVTGGTTDAVAYAIAVDALRHPGPAQANRISRTVCHQLLMPGVTNPQAAQALVGTLQSGLGSLGIVPGPLSGPVSGAPSLHSEPVLPCYVYASCAPQVALKLRATPTRLRVGQATKVTFQVTATVSGVTLPVPQAKLTLSDGRHLTTGSNGQASVTLKPRTAGLVHVTARDREYFPGYTTLTVSR